jgi:hypothetical protein
MQLLPENAWSVTKIRLSMTKMLPNNAFYVRFSTYKRILGAKSHDFVSYL